MGDARWSALLGSWFIGFGVLRYRHTNVQAFENALKKGEIARVEDDNGIPYLAFKSFEIGRVDGKSFTQTRTGHQSLTKEAL